MMWNILIYVNWFLLTFSGCWRIAFWVAQSFIYLFVFCRSCSKLFSVPWCSFNPKMGSCSMALYLLPSCSSFFFYSAIYWISNVHATCLLAVPVSIVFRFLFRTCVPDNILLPQSGSRFLRYSFSSFSYSVLKRFVYLSSWRAHFVACTNRLRTLEGCTWDRNYFIVRVSRKKRGHCMWCTWGHIRRPREAAKSHVGKEPLGFLLSFFEMSNSFLHQQSTKPALRLYFEH